MLSLLFAVSRIARAVQRGDARAPPHLWQEIAEGRGREEDAREDRRGVRQLRRVPADQKQGPPAGAERGGVAVFQSALKVVSCLDPQ